MTGNALRVAVLALASFAAPLSAGAQQPAKIPRVGVLSPGNPPPGDQFRQREAFEAGLADLGWTPGTRVIIEYRYAEGTRERLSELAAELVRLPVDVIVARSGSSIRAAQQTTRTIPIVMSATLDPVQEGFVTSLARPGGNITGLTLLAQDLDGKRLELLKEAVPRLSRVGILRNVNFTPVTEYDTARRQIEVAAQALKLATMDFPVSRAEDLGPTFTAMGKARVGAILVRADPLVLEPNLVEVVALAAHRKMPAVYGFRQFSESGGLMSYGADIRDVYRRSAAFVDKILKGAKPGDLPIEQPTKLELVINIKTAKALGLTIPQSVLVRADEVIR